MIDAEETMRQLLDTFKDDVEHWSYVESPRRRQFILTRHVFNEVTVYWNAFDDDGRRVERVKICLQSGLIKITQRYRDGYTIEGSDLAIVEGRLRGIILG